MRSAFEPGLHLADLLAHSCGTLGEAARHLAGAIADIGYSCGDRWTCWSSRPAIRGTPGVQRGMRSRSKLAMIWESHSGFSPQLA
jgi:hypothetical protein